MMCFLTVAWMIGNPSFEAFVHFHGGAFARTSAITRF
jgi:hypothetical protein